MLQKIFNIRIRGRKYFKKKKRIIIFIVVMSSGRFSKKENARPDLIYTFRKFHAVAEREGIYDLGMWIK